MQVWSASTAVGIRPGWRVQELDVIDHVRLISRALPCLDTTVVVVTYASDKRDDMKNALACGNGGCSGRGTSKLPEG
jgi:hypothetical protein